MHSPLGYIEVLFDPWVAIGVSLLVLWLLGFFGRRRLPRLRGGGGNVVHVLLVIILILIVLRLLGLASRLPVPAWLPGLDLDADGDPEALRAAAPRKALVAVTPGWRRLRGPAALAALDPALDGWDATRRLLGG